MDRIKNNDNFDSKQRILEAAKEVFVEKGFEGARVDEIARRAGLNKAMLYYYFENKEHIFKELFSKVRDGLIHSRGDLFDNLETPSRESFKNSFKLSTQYLQDNQDSLNIVLMETLKQNSNISLPEFLFPQVRQIIDLLDKWNIEIDDRVKIMLDIMYFAIIPHMLFDITGEKYAEVLEYDYTDLREEFSKLLERKIMSYFFKE